MHLSKRAGLAALVGLLCLPSVVASANMWRGNEGHAEKRVEHLTEALGLNQQQAAQIKTILDAQRAEMEQTWTAMREKTRQQINTVLTPDQQAKYAEFLKKRDERRRKWQDEDDDEDDKDQPKAAPPAAATPAPAPAQ